ncbi:hypothetical protein B5F53_07515 [Blautia sp. An249]|nr:hypothetical protein B5F53_07515 [Blautia sp. An249]
MRIICTLFPFGFFMIYHIIGKGALQWKNPFPILTQSLVSPYNSSSFIEKDRDGDSTLFWTPQRAGEGGSPVRKRQKENHSGVSDLNADRSVGNGGILPLQRTGIGSRPVHGNRW